MTHDKPLVNLRVFRHRNFLLGCLLIAIFGALLYGLITLLPLFYQELLGYTAFAAGWAVSPRGIGAILAMPVIGVLTNKIDSRWLIACGFVMFGISSLRFGQADLAISQWSFVLGDHSQRLWLGLDLCSAIGRHGHRTGKRGDRQCQRTL